MCLVQCMHVELVERGVYGDCPKWCMVALEKWIWPFTAFEAPYITQAMTLLICASHCVHLPSRPALNCQNVSSYHSTYKYL
jgi:hypothetical protein